jgi:hypothetical protein
MKFKIGDRVKLKSKKYFEYKFGDKIEYNFDFLNNYKKYLNNKIFTINLIELDKYIYLNYKDTEIKYWFEEDELISEKDIKLEKVINIL